MSVSNLFKRGGLRWSPDSDSTNAGDADLLGCDNLVPDQTGALALRGGSSKLYSSLNPLGDGEGKSKIPVVQCCIPGKLSEAKMEIIKHRSLDRFYAQAAVTILMLSLR